MAVLKDFKNRIDKGQGACRIDAWDSVLVFRILDGVHDLYYVGGLHNDKAQGCYTWDGVLDEIGDQWANAEGWQSYQMARVEVIR